MEWKESIVNKFLENDSFEKERNNFEIIIKKFNKINELIDDDKFYYTPEGGCWIVKISEGFDVRIELCSYWVKNPEISYLWVDYKKETNQFIVEINYKDGSKEEKILLDKSEFVEMYP